MTDSLDKLSAEATQGQLEIQRGDADMTDMELWVRNHLTGKLLMIGMLNVDDMWAEPSDEELLEQNKTNAKFLQSLWNDYRSASLIPAGWREEDVRYFVSDPCEDNSYPMTLEQARKEVDYFWDNAPHDGWPENMEALTVWRAVPISKAVEISRRDRTECPVCCGGEIEDELSEASGSDDCPNCEGQHYVFADEQDTPWPCYSEFECIIEYQMQPPLPTADTPPTQSAPADSQDGRVSELDTVERVARAMFEANGGKSDSPMLNADQNDWQNDQNMAVYRKLAPVAIAAVGAESRVSELEAEVARLKALSLQQDFDIATLLANLDDLEEATGEGPEDEDAILVHQVRSELAARADARAITEGE